VRLTPPEMVACSPFALRIVKCLHISFIHSLVHN
jgi:hypothetical protein